ncbi:MAG: GntR family transcriptional regulator [Acutalibacteraceae bacterium]|nr:GntR family transcriptional regulator [Acutalibacteraceae bacterium]
MNLKIDKGKPICPQIYELICADISAQRLKTEEKLPSVREIAVELGINPNTVQKAFERLESSGLTYSVRGTGWFVADNKAVADQIVSNLIREKTKQYFESLESYGMSESDIKKYIEEWNK